MDGLLAVDKPSGPTSHDVVARMRRALGERRIGHTGTLDPLATGLLLLVLGKATRLAKFLSASDKSYEATVRFGFATDTADAQGQPLGPIIGHATPSRDAIDAALEEFRGTFLQQPPAFSAKKIEGQRSYKLARKARDARLKPSRYPPALPDQPAPPDLPSPPDLSNPPDLSDPLDLSDLPDLPDPPDPPALPATVSVTAHAIRIVNLDGDHVTLSVDCSAGFYIRSLAHDLGQRLGVGAHLTALRRTRTGDFGLDRALSLDALERDPAAAAKVLVPLSGALRSWPSVVLTADGVVRVGHGQDVRPMDLEPAALSPQPFPLRSAVDPASFGEARQSAEGATAAALSPEPSRLRSGVEQSAEGERTAAPSPETSALGRPFVRLLDSRGDLLAIAEPTPSGALHPSVVLM
ncbi:MAG TPA: tRNA pseudouridine(55) synthase TruB [Vicinamibacterales bacterium]|nr:tRNA pseudouridine(55) synthase TruB [Vicinamibacterales bacterium]